MTAPESIFDAWRMFSKGKGSRRDVMVYKRHLEENLFELREEILSGSYVHGAYEPFIVCDTKQRLIHKATVKDRIVHQMLFNAVELFFEKSFVCDSFSCRKGKGIHAASKRLVRFLREASRNNTRAVYSLKCDIRKFFDTIDHDVLFGLLFKKISDERIRLLMQRIIFSFEKTKGKGLPLGNLTSQLFANVYLHQFDFYVKNVLREKYYIRYCDDFIILNNDRDYLIEILAKINRFLTRELKMTLHPNKIHIRNWNQGIDFVGYVHFPHCVVLRNKTKKRMFKKVNDKNISSYLGLCKHADTFEIQKMLLNQVAVAYPFSISRLSL